MGYIITPISAHRWISDNQRDQGTDVPLIGVEDQACGTSNTRYGWYLSNIRVEEALLQVHGQGI